MSLRQHKLTADDDHFVKISDWCPANGSAPLAVIQVLHGLGEHTARYERFAKACNDNRLIVVAHNHRGHGAIEGCVSVSGVKNLQVHLCGVDWGLASTGLYAIGTFPNSGPMPRCRRNSQ